MRRLILFSLVILIVSATACLANEINLVGTWQGPMTLHSKQSGFTATDGSNGKLIIEKQQDYAFYGKREWTREGNDRVEKFSGVISPDGRRIYFVGHDDGYFFGDVLGFDELVIYYLEDGDKAKAIRRNLKRLK